MGQAYVCQYNIPCKCGAQLPYRDQMIRGTLIVGLADEDIRLDVLGQTNQEISLRKQSASSKPKIVESFLLVKSIPTQQLYLWQSLRQAIHTGKGRENGSKANLWTVKQYSKPTMWSLW
ncbi:hypothetical protein PoB_005948500 [Plakobranchus ocellatus]|uniref:Uncharacterized protein n=1 Tax=Plakobranchus ocellatus TaxID=259542 RepID=A0AAV4CJC3_9GAST|nr:hypothetical protein PoB_005948500 [Plakobranchus ocellatus]